MPISEKTLAAREAANKYRATLPPDTKTPEEDRAVAEKSEFFTDYRARLPDRVKKMLDVTA